MAVNDVIVNGMALNDFGLTETNTINGYGLNTFGFIWECGSFWYGPFFNNGASITTNWSLFLSYSTAAASWTLFSTTTISTGWSMFTTSDQGCTIG